MLVLRRSMARTRQWPGGRWRGLHFESAGLRQLKSGGGEDAYFTAERDVGVLDGVGGAQAADPTGISVREFTESVAAAMRARLQAFRETGATGVSRLSAQVMLNEAVADDARNAGSSTIAMASLDTEAQTVDLFCLGDSSVLVLRPVADKEDHAAQASVLKSLYCVKAGTLPMEQGFNFPIQFGKDKGSGTAWVPQQGVGVSCPVAPGDVVIAGTDGLFDNLPHWELLLAVEQTLGSGKSAQETAEHLVEVTNKHMYNTETAVPWGEQRLLAAQLARQRLDTLPAHKDVSDQQLVRYIQSHPVWAPIICTRREDFVGGKVDDVTVVVAQVVS